MHAFRISALAARLGLASLVVATPANATAGGRDSARAALSTVASWQMNEAATASVMGDSSGHGITGSIGAHIQTHQAFDGAVGYRWVFRKPEEPPADPQRLVQVANRSALNPGTGTYVVTIRMRTTQDFGNIVQKGQAGAKGGYWKLENPHGVVHCLFRGPSKVGINVDSGMAINDGKWHVIRCERTSSGVTMTVDGHQTGHTNGSTGNISNPNPVTIGGKLNCDQHTVTCDYFTGSIDYITIQAS